MTHATSAVELRGLTHRWRMRPAGSSASRLGVEPVLARILAARGMEGPEQAGEFLDPRLTLLHDPSLVPNLDAAAERILAAARGGERVAIYGDYDVDGIASTAILYHALRAAAPGCDLVTYVPHRVDEGYGLHAGAIEELASAGARVIVSVDCGITAVEAALRARALGVDLIITDHHNPRADGAIPDAMAVVHPRLPGSRQPFGELCGTGVAFKLAWRVATLAAGSERVGEEMRAALLELLALASLGVIADVVPLVGENRVMARHGLALLSRTSNVGLRALIEASGLGGGRIDAQGVGFGLAPRLNASGRLGHAREAVELLTTADEPRAREIAASLCRLNNERRTTERRVVEEASALAESAGMTDAARRAIVLADERWHPGVLGIACSRLVDRFSRPTILMRREGDECHGSGRSVRGFSLHAALAACEAHLSSYGGHDMAAGLRLRADRLESFVEAFTAEVNAALGPDDLAPLVSIDADATLAELDARAVSGLERMGPFGTGNPRPRVRVVDATIARWPEPLGQHGRHLSLHAEDPSGRVVRVVGWGWGERRAALARGMRADLVVSPRLSTWGGRTAVEPELVDVRPLWSASP